MLIDRSKVTKLQDMFLNNMKAQGAIAFVARSIEDVEEVLKNG